MDGGHDESRLPWRRGRAVLRRRGGPLAGWEAGDSNVHTPFWMGAGVVFVGALILDSGRNLFAHVDAEGAHGTAEHPSVDDADVALGDA